MVARNSVCVRVGVCIMLIQVRLWPWGRVKQNHSSVSVAQSICGASPQTVGLWTISIYRTQEALG